MTQHPLTTAFEHLDEQPAPGFRETLLAEMLVELTQPSSAQDVDASDTEPQEITVLKKIDRSNPAPTRTRVIVGLAAAVIVAVGITAFVVNRRNADTTVVPVTTPEPSPADTATANAALLTVDQLGYRVVTLSGVGRDTGPMAGRGGDTACLRRLQPCRAIVRSGRGVVHRSVHQLADP